MWAVDTSTAWGEFVFTEGLLLMTVNPYPLAVIQRDSQPCKVNNSVAQLGLHGIPTNSKSALLESSRVEQHVGRKQEGRCRPLMCGEEEGERISWWRGRKEVRSGKRTWDERWLR
jgi:hypothetical protein